MHIHGTRTGRSRFHHHLTRTVPEPPDDPFTTTGSKVNRGHARERLDHLHEDFELEERFARDLEE
jgi:hypothetical protein